MQSHAYYEEPLSPASGMQSQLPILLAEYTFRTERDVQDYLELLAQTGDYYDSLLVYEQEKAAAGLPMSRVSLEKVRGSGDQQLPVIFLALRVCSQSPGKFLPGGGLCRQLFPASLWRKCGNSAVRS